MPTFRKYKFTSEAAYQALPTPDGNAVPLGEIDGYWCIDILWADQPDQAYKPYEVWPSPIGVHTFLGWDEQYTKDYNAHHGLETDN
jgi:hypothetical protein